MGRGEDSGMGQVVIPGQLGYGGSDGWGEGQKREELVRALAIALARSLAIALGWCWVDDLDMVEMFDNLGLV